MFQYSRIQAVLAAAQDPDQRSCDASSRGGFQVTPKVGAGATVGNLFWTLGIEVY
jgi:hypothetical protein